MDGFGVTSAFWALAGLAVVSAMGIMLSRNLFHAVLWLILTFIALAGLYITLSADFVAVAQVLVYAGAVGVLVVFAIMLTPNSATSNSETRFFGPGFIAASVISGIMVYVAADTDWNTLKQGDFGTTAQQIGSALTNRYVLPFEVASVLLIAAMVGAIVLVRGERPRQQAQAAAQTEAAREMALVEAE
jgi:NADH:ubiquinone oxidoreductase subunit 6 (subunit J)